MGKALTAAKRKAMPKSKFAEPKKKAFPLNDAKHQKLAIGGATRSFNAGNIGKGTENRIKSEARKDLSKGKPTMAKKETERKDHHDMKRVEKKEDIFRKHVEKAHAGKPVDRKTGGTEGRGRFGGYKC